MMPNRAQQPTTKTEDVPKFVFEPLALKEDSKVETPDMYKMLRFNENIGNTSGYNGRMIKAWRLLTKHKAEEFIISGTDTETLNTMIRRNPQLHCDSLLAAMPAGCYLVTQPNTTGCSSRPGGTSWQAYFC
jgi:hypothetical protein